MDHTATLISPQPVTAVPRRDRVALGLLVSAQFLVMLDASIVNVALPSIQGELDFGPAAVTWVVNAYVLAFAGLLLLAGRAADLIGRRRIFVSGAALFTAGTLLAAAAVNQQMLILGRVVQGVGAAGLSPAAMSLLLATFPAAQRARAMGAWGAASTLGGATGVVSGGVLAGSVGWRAVFLVTVPVSLAAFALGRRVLAADEAGVRRTFDWAGAAAVCRCGDRPGARRRGRRRPRLDLPAGRRSPCRLRGPDDGLRRHRTAGRRSTGPPRALQVGPAS